MPCANAEKTKLEPITLQEVQVQDIKSIRDLIINEEKGLQLREALQWLKETHPDLRLARLKLQQAEAKFLASQGAFDPNFIGDYNYARFNSDSKPGVAQQSWLNDSSVQLLTRYGLKVETGYRIHRGNLSATVQPTGEGGEIYTQFIIPLMRYARGKNPLAIAERKAALNLQIAALDLYHKELALQQKLGITYWAWLAARRQLQNSERVLELAKTREAQVAIRASAGDLPAIANVEIQKEVAKRQAQLAKDQMAVKKENIKLSLLLWARDTEEGRLDVDAAWVPLLDSVPMPEAVDDKTLLADGKIAIMKSHPTLLKFPISKDMAKLDVDLAKQLFLPKVDAYLRPSAQMGKQSISPPGFYGALKVEMPIRNRTGKGKLRAAELVLQSIDVDYLQSYGSLVADVEMALVELSNYYDLYLAAQKEWEATLALEKGERIKFSLGDSTLFVVNIRERETALAFRKVVESEKKYHQAMITYLTTTTQI